jgi:uncharacterized protein (TIGR03437 family)
MKVRWSAGTLALDLAGTRVACAATTAWAFNATFGNPRIQAYHFDPGVASGDFAALDNGAQWGASNTQLSAGVRYSVAAKSLFYVGAAPAPAAGLFQVNDRVPANGPPVSAPLVLRFGKATSQPGVTRAT